MSTVYVVLYQGIAYYAQPQVCVIYASQEDADAFVASQKMGEGDYTIEEWEVH